jgi:3-deoxy-D-arabino-heptulosonate 7-phosphate (DAHP) synthase class II
MRPRSADAKGVGHVSVDGADVAGGKAVDHSAREHDPQRAAKAEDEIADRGAEQ